MEDILYNNKKYNAQQLKQQSIQSPSSMQAVPTTTTTTNPTSIQLAHKLRQIKENLEKSIQNNPNQIQHILSQQHQRNTKYPSSVSNRTPSNTSTISISSSSTHDANPIFNTNPIHNRISQFEIAQTNADDRVPLRANNSNNHHNDYFNDNLNLSINSEDSFYKNIIEPNASERMQQPLVPTSYMENLSRQSSVRSLMSLDKKITEMAQTRKLVTNVQKQPQPQKQSPKSPVSSSISQPQQVPKPPNNYLAKPIGQQQQQQIPKATNVKNEKILLLNWEDFDTQSNNSSLLERPQTSFEFHKSNQSKYNDTISDDYRQQFCYSEDGSTTMTRSSRLNDHDKSVNSEFIDNVSNMFNDRIMGFDVQMNPKNSKIDHNHDTSVLNDSLTSVATHNTNNTNKYERYKRLSTSINKIFSELFDNFDKNKKTTNPVRTTTADAYAPQLNISNSINDSRTTTQISKQQQQQSKQNMNDLSMIERYLNSEQQYGDVLRLLECAYAENGDYLVDYTLVEYVLSQSGISFNTFKQSIREKFEDIEWADDLLWNLYLTVNKNKANYNGSSADGMETGKNKKADSEFGDSTTSTNITPTNKSYLKLREIKYVSQQKRKNRNDTGSLRSQQQANHQQAAVGPESINEQASGLSMKSNRWQKEIENFIDKNFHLNKFKAKRIGSLPDLKFNNSSSSFNCSTVTGNVNKNTYANNNVIDDYYSVSSSYQLESSLKQYNAFILDILRPNSNVFKSKSTTDLHNSFLVGSNNPDYSNNADDMNFENLDAYRGLIWQCADMCYSNFMLKYEELHWLLDGGSFSIQSKLKEVDQRLLIDMKLYANNERFYTNLITTNSKNNMNKNNLRLSKQLDTLKEKINELKSMRLFLLMCQSNTNSLDANTLEFVFSSNKRDPSTLKSERVMQAKSVSTILTSLYGSEAIRNGFAYLFFINYRYYYSSIQLFEFLSETFRQSLRINEPNIKRSLILRTIDLLAMWVDGFFTIDFQKNENLFELYELFLQNEVQQYDSNVSKKLLKLLNNPCLEFNTFALSNRQSLINLSKTNLKIKTKSNSKLNRISLKTSKSSMAKSFQTSTSDGIKSEQCIDDMFNESSHFNSYQFKNGSSSSVISKSHTSSLNLRHLNEQSTMSTRKFENFSLNDYPVILIASQLTLIEWDNFLNIHPCHCLNSKAQGIYTDSKAPINAENIFNENSSLFIENYLSKSIYKMIEFNYLVKHWIAAEILATNKLKNQVGLITKFLQIAKLCCDWSNFSTAFSIYDGLQDVLVKQLPAWKHVSNKAVEVLDTIASFKLLLQNEPLLLYRLCQSTSLPAIPSMHLFLLTVQQNEHGSFQLVNGLWKWSKLSYLATLVDQIRVIQQHYVYGFQKYEDLIVLLIDRIEWFKDVDLNSLAENNCENVYNPKLSSSVLSDISSTRSLFKKPSIYSISTNSMISTVSTTPIPTPNFAIHKKL